jgi:hypothetical protein
VAIVTWPLSSGEARGRVGGLVYNTWRGRSYVKTCTTPKTEFSDSQVFVRDITSSLTVAWHALSDAQRSVWNNFAFNHTLANWTGQPKRISGYNWFVKLGYNSYRFFDGPYVSPPAVLPSYVIDQAYAFCDPPIIQLVWNPQTVAPQSEWSLSFWLEGPYDNPRTPSVKRAKFFDIANEDEGGWVLMPADTGFYYVHWFSIANCGLSTYQWHNQVHVT